MRVPAFGYANVVISVLGLVINVASIGLLLAKNR